MQAEFEARMLALEAKIVSQIKLWFFSGLFFVVLTFVGGFAGLAFYLGSLSTQFQQSVSMSNQTSIDVADMKPWVTRKDALDDDMIRYLRSQGYEPPAWYVGNDATVLAK